ncbi:hypothetical protein [Natronorubrum sp. FCH18a]|uniref:hypothetical protein n=1 Tax=Natronorubrum sp. FCH18a TaxID=3447018 RepID=UPI003F511A21
MEVHAFLDTGVVLGFCFTTDMHHLKCKDYIQDDEKQCYITADVNEAYKRKKPYLTERYSDAILDHADKIKGSSSFEGQLDSLDIRDIREDLLSAENDSYQFLYWYYKRKVPNYIMVEDLCRQLREIARDIEGSALKRKEILDDILEMWCRENDYESVADALSPVHAEDRDICLDAHDLACERTGTIELATTDPKDFVKNGHRELILENTEISDVVSLAITS